MANQYDTGDRIEIDTSTVFQDSDGSAVDPDTVRYKVKDPDGNTTTYVYNTDNEVTRNGAGDYTLTIDVNTRGVWHYRIEGEQTDGENRGAKEGYFVVRGSNV